MPDTPELPNDYLLNATQAGAIVERDSHTVRQWYSDWKITDKFPNFIKKEKNTDSGISNVLISVSELAKIARMKRLRVNYEAVKRYIPEDMQEVFREEMVEQEKITEEPKKEEVQENSQFMSFVLTENGHLKRAIETKDQEIARLNKEYLDKSDKLNENLIKLEALRIIASMQNAENNPVLVQAIRKELGVVGDSNVVDVQPIQKKTLFQRWFGD